MPELLTLNRCHCGAQKLNLSQISESHYEVRCTKCADFAWGSTADGAVKKWNKTQGGEENPNLSHVIPNTVKDCCKHSMNLVEQQTGQTDKRILVCRICGCRHIRFKADTGKIMSKGG